MEQTWMLSSRNQKILKFVHLCCVACVIGGMVSMSVLTLLKEQAKVGENPFLLDWSVYHLFNTVVNYAFFGLLGTGFVYAMFTKWGFFKHHWVTIKWIGAAILFVTIWFWAGPAINGTVALSDGGVHLSSPAEYLAYSARSRVWILIEGGLALLLCLISVYKPWGVRKREFAVNRKLILIVVGLLAIGGGVNAVLTSLRLQKYRSMAIADSDLSRLADGVYPGEATVGSFTYQVEVAVQNHVMTDIRIVANRTTPYASYAEGVIPKVLNAQNANVDTVTGATTTSKALLKTIENALKTGAENR